MLINRQASCLAEAFSRFKELVRGWVGGSSGTLVAYNGYSFDLVVLQKEISVVLCEDFISFMEEVGVTRILDPLKIYQSSSDIKKKFSNKHTNSGGGSEEGEKVVKVSNRVQLKNSSMYKEVMGKDLPNAHDALADCKGTAEVLFSDMVWPHISSSDICSTWNEFRTYYNGRVSRYEYEINKTQKIRELADREQIQGMEEHENIQELL
jgi:hypothetical protein